VKKAIAASPSFDNRPKIRTGLEKLEVYYLITGHYYALGSPRFL